MKDIEEIQKCLDNIAKVFQLDKKATNFDILILGYGSGTILADMRVIKISSKGKKSVIIDMILHSGNDQYRFIKTEIFDGRFDISNCEFVKIERLTTCIRGITSKFLVEEPELLNNSILSSVVKKMILKGIII